MELVAKVHVPLQPDQGAIAALQPGGERGGQRGLAAGLG